jgi:hypothetical protein
MKRISWIFLCLLAFSFSGCETASQVIGTVLTSDDSDEGEKPLTQQEAGLGIKEALKTGLIKGVQVVSKENGYFGNNLIRIPWPQA